MKMQLYFSDSIKRNAITEKINKQFYTILRTETISIHVLRTDLQ